MQIKALQTLEAWAGSGELGIRIQNVQLVIITIALDRVLFSIQEYRYFSHFSMKTYVMV